jgi:hypothetical protein
MGQARRRGTQDERSHSAQDEHNAADVEATLADITKLLEEFGGRREARTRDLRVANAALSQLS